MRRLKKLDPSDFDALLPIVVKEEPFGESVTLEQMRAELIRRDGWTVWSGDRLVGCVTLCNFTPLHNVMIHAVVDSDFQGRWVNRSILREVFTYCFMGLEVRRVSAYGIPWKTFRASKMLTDMGFKVEGVTRLGGMTPGGEYYDVINYGMLREECRWL